MTTIASLVTDHGGLLHKRSLQALGATDKHLTAAVRFGGVLRPRRGWYSTFRRSDPRFVAVRVGGRLTGASALAQLGAWMWNDKPRVTVSVPSNASRLRKVRGARVVWDDPDVAARGSLWSVAPADAIREALIEVEFEDAVSILDWALHTRVIDDASLARITARLPHDLRNIGEWTDAKCESFLESIARTRARLDGHEVTSQHSLETGERVDLIIDGVVGLELDGRKFHGNTFTKDRRKDLTIILDGRTPMRLSYVMVEDDWPKISRAICSAVSSHRGGAVAAAENSGPGLPRPARPRKGQRIWHLATPRRRPGPELPAGGREQRGLCRRSPSRKTNRRIATISG